MQTKSLQTKRALRTALLVLMLSLAGIAKLSAQNFVVDNLRYSVNSDGVSVTLEGLVQGTPVSGSLEIPEYVTYNSIIFPVTTIGYEAFSHPECSGFTGTLTIPSSVINQIAGTTFLGCTNLDQILVAPGNTRFDSRNYSNAIIETNTNTLIKGCKNTIIPNSVTSIVSHAFENCIDLTSISIPNSVISIGMDAFVGTGWYTAQPDGILYLDSWCLGYKGEKPTGTLVINGTTKAIASFAFSGCNLLTGNLIIPSSVTSIGSYAFYYCSGFTGSLTIPNSVTSIGDCAFFGCSGFTGSLTIPNSVTSIGVGAFMKCIGFTGDLIIPNSVTKIGGGAFGNCSGLTSISIPNSVSSMGIGVFDGTGWFEDQGDGILYLDHWCLGYKGEKPTGSLVLEEDIRGIADQAFILCDGLTGLLTIPNSVISIGSEAFSGCTGFIGNLVIPNSVTEIGGLAFSGCIGFTGDLIIPNSVTKIGRGAFCNCKNFSGELNISNSVTVIDDYTNQVFFNDIDVGTFENCCGFTSIEFGNSLTRIGPKSFRGCRGLTGNLIIPNSVITIGGFAFSGCNGLTGCLTIGNSVNKIGGWAFSNCTGFTGNLIIPNSVITIGGFAFSGCTGFTGDLSIPNSVASIGDFAFDDCSGFTGSLTIPNSVTTIGSHAFYNCNGFTGSLSLGNSVTTIGESAFSSCENLTTITIGKSVRSIGSMAFANNPRLNMIYYNVEKDLEAATNVFDNCPNLTTIHIGPEVQEIGSNIFNGCNTVHFVVALGPTPAVLDAGAFSDIVDNSVLMVSCGKRVTYYSVWNMFPFNNIIEDCDTYGINVGAVGSGGTITPSATEAQMGQEVQITITPNPGMVLVSIKVVNANDPTQIIPISPSGKAASTYSFTMPPFEVVVMATFKSSGASVDENNSIEVAVYPNPTNGLVKIEAESIKHISISNMLGQVVFDGKVVGDAFEYDFSGQKTGIYLVRIETASGVAVKKVSVTR